MKQKWTTIKSDKKMRTMTHKKNEEMLMTSINGIKEIQQCEHLINWADEDQLTIEGKMKRLEHRLRNDAAKEQSLQVAIEEYKFELSLLDSIISQLLPEAEHMESMTIKRLRLNWQLFDAESRLQVFDDKRKVTTLFELQLHCARQQKTAEFLDRIKDRLKKIKDLPPDKAKAKVKTSRKAA
jgi:hypothetical protein